MNDSPIACHFRNLGSPKVTTQEAVLTAEGKGSAATGVVRLSSGAVTMGTQITPTDRSGVTVLVQLSRCPK